jgi:hypothetical protein
MTCTTQFDPTLVSILNAKTQIKKTKTKSKKKKKKELDNKKAVQHSLGPIKSNICVFLTLSALKSLYSALLPYFPSIERESL